MKKTLKLLAALSLLVVADSVLAQKAPKLAQLEIHSNPVCGECKQIIETEMLYAKGVHAVNVDVDARLIHVEYKPKKTDPEKLRQAVTKIGYEADGLAPDMKARTALPMCCQVEDHEDPHPAKPGVPQHQE